MKKASKLLALALSALLMASALTACGDGSTSSSAPGGSAAPSGSEASGESVDISLAFWSIGAAIPEDTEDAVRDYVYDKLGLTITPVDMTWDDYEQKLALMATSDDLPDAFAIDLAGKPLMNEWINQGIIQPLPDDLSKYPNIQAILDTPEYALYKYPLGADDAKYYGIPRPNYRDNDWVANDYGIIIRKDWMEALGKSEPTSYEEFVELMVAFATKDPDGNGLNDTVGFTPYNQNAMGLLMNAYEPGLTAGGTSGAYWVADEKNPGQWIPSFMTDGALEGYKAIRSLYDAGGLDPDFAIIKGEEGIDKFANGGAGALGYGGNYGSLWGVWDKFSQVSPEAKFEDTFMVLKPFKNADGNYYRYVDNSAWSETYLNANISPEKMDKVLSLYDYMLSDEGYRVMHFGMEGTDWTVENGEVVLHPVLDADGNATPVTTLYPFCKLNSFAEWSGTGSYINPSIFPEIRDTAIASRDWLLDNAKPVDTDLRLKFLDYPSKSQDTASFSDDVAKIVLSNDVEAAFNQVVADHLANGYTTIIAEVNAEATALGITT